MLILKNGQNQILCGDNSHIIDHKINSDNNNYIDIIIAKDFEKILKTVNVLWFFIKAESKKILKLGYILQANINSILVRISEQYYHHLLSPEVYCSYCNRYFEA